MDEKKIFDLLEKIYVELKADIKDVKADIKDVKTDIKDIRTDISKLGAKIDGEITDKLKILSDEQAIMRSDIHEIKEHQQLHDIKLEDLKITVNSLEHKQRDQEKEIWELTKVK